MMPFYLLIFHFDSTIQCLARVTLRCKFTAQLNWVVYKWLIPIHSYICIAFCIYKMTLFHECAWGKCFFFIFFYFDFQRRDNNRCFNNWVCWVGEMNCMFHRLFCLFHFSTATLVVSIFKSSTPSMLTAYKGNSLWWWVEANWVFTNEN